MEKKVLRVLSHPFEGEMLKDMLKNIGIDAWVSDQSGPHKVENYLGQKAGDTLLLVLEKDYDEAKAYLEAEIIEPDYQEAVPMMKFPYWIIPAIALILIFFALLQMGA